MFKNVPKKEYKAIPWSDCIAKTIKERDITDKIVTLSGMSVLDHCLLSGYFAEFFVSRLPVNVSKHLPKGIGILVALHDIGKVGPGFCYKINPFSYFKKVGEHPGEGEFETNHAIIGEKTLESRSSKWSWVAGSHHGMRQEDGLLKSTSPACGGNSWNDEREKLISAIEKEMGQFDFSQECTDIGLLFSIALTSEADWFVSSDIFDQRRGKLQENKEKINKVINNICHFLPKISEKTIFKDIFGFDPNDLQSVLSEIENKQLELIIEGQMGGGKTYAAIFVALCLMRSGINSGLYFALPTKMTSDMIFTSISPVIKKAFDSDSVQLIHADSWMTKHSLEMERNGLLPIEKSYDWYNGGKKSMLDVFGVGTIDNALMGVIRTKYNFIRLFGLANKVVIIDEVHSYDMYTSTIIKELKKVLLEMGCSVIILSATLTESIRNSFFEGKKTKKIDAYPLISYSYVGDDEVKYIAVKPPGNYSINIKCSNQEVNYEDLIYRAECLKQKILLIRNTVDKEQKDANQLNKMSKDHNVKIVHLNSRFKKRDRRAVEKEIIELLGKESVSAEGCIVIGTQILEQSLDIDADYLVTDLCPMDFLLQRGGRLWRFKNLGNFRMWKNRIRPCENPEMLVLIPQIGLNGHYVFDPVYDKYVCERTMEVLKETKNIVIPQNIRELISKVYDERDEKDVHMIGLRIDSELKNKRLKEKAFSATCKMMPVRDDDERSFSRYSDIKSFGMLMVKKVEQDKERISFVFTDGEVCEISRDMSRTQMIDKKSRLVMEIVDVSLSDKKSAMRSGFEIENQFPEWNKVLPHNIDSVLYIDSISNRLYYDENYNVFSGLIWDDYLGMIVL